MIKRDVFPKLLLVILMACMLLVPALSSLAATTNPSPASSGYMVMPITFSRTISAVSTPVMARIKVPFPAAVVSVTAAAETADYTSTDEVYTVDVLEGSTSILHSAIGLAAADTVYQGVVDDKSMADESVLTVVLSAAGTTPSITDVTTTLVLKRL